MAYNYQNPLDRGHTRFKISRKKHNIIFPRRKIKWFIKCEYYYNDEKIIIHRFIKPVAVLINTLVFPVTIFINGLVNIREVWESLSENYNQKKTGSFSSDYIYKNEKKYHEVMEIIKNKSH